MEKVGDKMDNPPVNGHIDNEERIALETWQEKDVQLLLDQHETLGNKYTRLEDIKSNVELEDKYESLLEECKATDKKSPEKTAECFFRESKTFYLPVEKMEEHEKILLEEKNESLLKYIKGLEEKHEESKLKEKEYSALESKHQKLVGKLRERIECPVCLEVPQAGPVSICPNGHLVCVKCKSNSCPTCRSRMFEGKSLLAVTVLENIEHKCRNQECEQLLPLTEIEAHKKVCTYRLLSCPAALCNQEVAFCNLIDHVMNDCNHSYAKDEKAIADLTSRKGFYQQGFSVDSALWPFMLETYMWNGKYFFFIIDRSVDRCGDWTFHVEMLGTEEECSEYKLELVLHKYEDIEAEGQFVFRFIGEPCSVDEEKDVKKRTGLIVNNRIMERKLCTQVTKEDEFQKFNISIAFKKN